MSKGKILFVTRYHFLRFTGGAELQCWMLATEFARRGWEVHYVSENSKPGMPELLDGVTLHYLPEVGYWKEGNREGIAAIMSRINPDVVYNRVFNLYTWQAMSLAPKHAVTIWAAASDADAAVLGFVKEMFRSKTIPQLLVLAPRLIHARYFARKGALSAQIRLAQHFEQQQHLKKVGIDTTVLRNSFPPTDADVLQKHEGKPSVFWAGSVKRWKQPELFIELARRCQDLDCEFVIAGEVFKKEYPLLLERAAAELRNFRYAGHIPLQEIDRYFAAAHLHIKTSQPLEGFPNTFVQAWQYGVPVVSLDVDPDGLLSRERLGAVVSSMDELEAKVRELLANPQLRREIGARAREFTLKEFNLHKNVDRLEELIRERKSR